MASIEINLETYNNLRNKIKELEVQNTELRKSNQQQDIIISDLKETIEIVKGANWFDRVFGWKQIKKIAEEQDIEFDF